jgi:hypothetical protein
VKQISAEFLMRAVVYGNTRKPLPFQPSEETGESVKILSELNAQFRAAELSITAQ